MATKKVDVYICDTCGVEIPAESKCGVCGKDVCGICAATQGIWTMCCKECWDAGTDYRTGIEALKADWKKTKQTSGIN